MVWKHVENSSEALYSKGLERFKIVDNYVDNFEFSTIWIFLSQKFHFFNNFFLKKVKFEFST